jgi:hypothetical protein
MIGLPSNIDWATLTLEHRKLEQDLLYSNAADDWQKEIDIAISKFPRIYLQLPRGHDKTERFAWWSLLWLETTDHHRGYCCGVDRDNAKLFRDASKKIVALHPDLFSSIVVEKHTVFSKRTGSYIETISSDVNSAYGLNFDLLIINDFHAWPDQDFWSILWTACGKKPNIRIWMESNALTLGSSGFQWVSEMRDWVAQDGVNQGDWFFYRPNSFLAKWQSSQVEQWRKTLHPSTFHRLIENEDCSDEESYLTPDQVEACEILTGPTEQLVIKNGPVVTSLDLGLTKDATAVCSVQALPTPQGASPRLVLLRLDVLTGSVDNPVALAEAESIVLEHREKFKSHPILCDPWNTQSLIQRHSFLTPWVFGSRSIQELTQLLYQSIANKHLLLYPNAGKAMQRSGSALRGTLSKYKEWDLKKELINAVLKPMPYGERVDHRASGFSDRLIALGMCIHYLMTECYLPTLKKPEKPKEKLSWDASLIQDWEKPLSLEFLRL